MNPQNDVNATVTCPGEMSIAAARVLLSVPGL